MPPSAITLTSIRVPDLYRWMAFYQFVHDARFPAASQISVQHWQIGAALGFLVNLTMSLEVRR